MKKLLISASLFFALGSMAQTKQKKPSTKAKSNSQTHVPASKTLVGIWRQTGAVNPADGKVYDIKSNNYKVINPDGTYYTFVNWNMENTSIGQYGTYTITSDSTMIEQIAGHPLVPSLNGKKCTVRYKLIDENTLMSAWSFDNLHWEGDRMTRLPLSGQKTNTNTTMILDTNKIKDTVFITKKH